MSLARRNRDRILAQMTASAPDMGGGFASASAPANDSGSPAERAAAQIQLRLTHDLRRLKEIQSIAQRIEVKRTMLPEYQAWLDGLLAGHAAPSGVAAEVLPVCMVWSIDTGDWPRALQLAAHVLAHDVPLPARYQRQAAVLIAEEIAEAALKAQNAGATFPLTVLEQVEQLTSTHDMPDQVRAKLAKALGAELAGEAASTSAGPLGATFLSMQALEALRRAQALHDRVGVKDKIKRLEKALAAPAAPLSAGTPPAA
jgi:hypothetical protein